MEDGFSVTFVTPGVISSVQIFLTIYLLKAWTGNVPNVYAELNYMYCECVIFVYIELNYTVNVLYLYILNSFALINVEFINWGECPTTGNGITST